MLRIFPYRAQKNVSYSRNVICHFIRDFLYLYIDKIKKISYFIYNYNLMEVSMKHNLFFVCLFLLNLCIVPTLFAQNNIDWREAEGSDPKNINSSLMEKLDLLGELTGIPPIIRWGFRTDEDREVIIERSYSDASLYRIRADGAVIRRRDGNVMVAARGQSPHERGEAVDIKNGDKYSDWDLEEVGLQREMDYEDWHITEQ
jgi:hypothetical protein